MGVVQDEAQCQHQREEEGEARHEEPGSDVARVQLDDPRDHDELEDEADARGQDREEHDVG